MMSTSHRTTSLKERNGNNSLLRHVPLSLISLVLGARLIRISASSVCLFAGVRTTAAVGYINAAACRTLAVGGSRRADQHHGTGTRRKGHMGSTRGGRRRRRPGGAAANRHRDGGSRRQLPTEGATALSCSGTRYREGNTMTRGGTGQVRGMC